jgi:hypothetical protein
VALATPLLCSGETEGHPASSAFDGTLLSYWQCPAGQKIARNAYIGLMYEESIEPRLATLYQWMSNLNGSTCISRIAIECSNDGFLTDIRRAATVTAREVRSHWKIPLSQVGGGRWWRALALCEPYADGDTWSVADFQLTMNGERDWPNPGPIAGSRSAPAHGPECAFDSGMTQPWVTLERHEEVEDNSWIGWDYGESRHERVVAFDIQQWDGGERPNVVSRVALEYSDDAFSSHSEPAAPPGCRRA